MLTHFGELFALRLGQVERSVDARRERVKLGFAAPGAASLTSESHDIEFVLTDINGGDPIRAATVFKGPHK